VTAGSEGSRSCALSTRVRGAGGPSVASSPPSSPLSVGLGGEGIRELVGKHAGSSGFFVKRSRRCSCFSAAADHLAGRGGEEVAWCLVWLARSGGGFIWEFLEFRLSSVLPPCRRLPATAICGHRDGCAVLVAFICASSLLFVRSFCPASAASKPPVQPRPKWFRPQLELGWRRRGEASHQRKARS
jgi:hypothetical protein